MNINLITTKSNIKKAYVRGSHILEMYEKDVGGATTFRYGFLDPSTGVSEEIAPEIGEYSFIPVINCIWQSGMAYLASCRLQEDGSAVITVFRHNPVSSETEELYSFAAEPLDKSSEKRIKIFVFPGNILIIQTEEQKCPTDGGTQAVVFSQLLANCENGAEILLKDKNLMRNGIDTVIPVSQTHMMLKTGFSRIEDKRFEGISGENAPIESVYYGITNSFLSSAPLDSTTSGFELIATAYNEKSILRPYVAGEYIHFTIVNPQEFTGETIFYNFKSGKALTCKDLALDPEDMRTAYVINNTPYIRQSYENQVEFINLLTSETECIFYNEKFQTALGGLLFFSKERRGKSYLRAYRLSKLDLAFEAKGSYAAGCRDGENYYIYVSV